MEIRRFFIELVESKFFIQVMFENIALCLMCSWLFYKSAYAFFIILILAVFRFKTRYVELEEAERQKMNQAFVDLLHIVRRLSSAGFADTQCFIQAEDEITLIYPEENAWIRNVLKEINGTTSLGVCVSKPLFQVGEKYGLPEVKDLSKMIEVIKNFGGNMSIQLGMATKFISERIETEHEIYLLASSKIFEQNVLFFLSCSMVIMLNFTMPEMFSVLYSTFIGRIVMTVSLCIMLAGRSIGKKLSKIEV